MDVSDDQEKEKAEDGVLMPRLIIDIANDGKMNVGGPIDNKLLCLGMLELAKQLVIDFKGEDKPGIIVPENRIEGI